MDFIDKLKQFSKRVESLKESLSTEEATKTSLIMPFFALLGYDVFNPDEFLPEYTADVGIKKGEKVDYAIMKDGEPVILIECKWIGENLAQHDSQLFRYFGTSKAKFGILTNGALYRFYTDLEEPNKMDEKPFLELDMLDIKESLIPELKKFHKDSFNVSEIFDAASELKYSNEIKGIISTQLVNPSDDYVRFFLQAIYSGQKTQSVIEKFRPIVKKSLNQFISEMMNDKIKSALNVSNSEPDIDTAGPQQDEEAEAPSKIVTTEEELEAFFLIKNLLKDVVPFSDIHYKDTESYMTILYKNNTRKWICRLILSSTQKVLYIPDENKKAIAYPLTNIYDIESYKAELVNVLSRYADIKVPALQP